MVTKAIIYLVASIVLGCATTDPAIKEACSRPYAETDDRCAKPRPVDTRGMVKVCRGISRADMTCSWARREDLEQILRRL